MRRSEAEVFGLCEADDGGRTDRNGPGVLVVRRALRRADARVQVLRKGNGGTERTGQQRLVAALRDRALLGLLVVLSSREGALFVDHAQNTVRVSHYDRAHEFRFPGIDDPVTLPAFCVHAARKGGLRIRPMWVALPEKLARWIDEYLDAAGIGDCPDHPFWIASQRRAGVAGYPALQLTSVDPVVKRMLSRVRGGGPYSPHTLRHSPGEPIARQMGEDWLAGRFDNDVVGLPESLSGPLDSTDRGRLSSGRVIADALLSHSFSSEDTNGYLNLEDHRERLATIGAFGIWAHVWGPLSCETEPDGDAMIEARDRLVEARNAADRLELQIAQKEQEIGLAEREAELALSVLAKDEKLDFFMSHNLRMTRLNREHAELLRVGPGRALAKAQAEAAFEVARTVRRSIPDQWIPEFPDDEPVSTVEATAMLLSFTGELLHTDSVIARLRRAGCEELNTTRRRTTPLLWRFGDLREHLLVHRVISARAEDDEDILALAAAEAISEPRPRTLLERLEEALSERDTMIQAEAALAFFGRGVSQATIKRAMNGQTKKGPFKPVERVCVDEAGRGVSVRQPLCVVGEPGSHNRRVVITADLKAWLLERPQHCEFAIAILSSPEGTHMADYAAGRR
jgi:hypothetical protein